MSRIKPENRRTIKEIEDGLVLGSKVWSDEIATRLKEGKPRARAYDSEEERSDENDSGGH